MVLCEALSYLALQHGRRISPRDFAAQCAHEGPASPWLEVAAKTLQMHDFDVRLWHGSLTEIFRASLPALLVLRDGEALVLLKQNSEHVVVWAAQEMGEQGGKDLVWAEQVWTIRKLEDRFTGDALFAKPNALAQAEHEVHGASSNLGNASQSGVHWFWSVFALLKPYYGDCVLAALLINVLALAASMFSMNVYDRIVPNAAMHSLWVLTIGVVVAGLLELGLRTLRAHTVDLAGKKADLILSAKIFSQTLNLKAKDRPASSGQYAGQVREFESVRDFVSSSTLVLVSDLPFAFLFLAVIANIGGHLAWIPLVAGVVVVLISMAAQLPLAQSVARYQYENSQKLAFMVEALERLETVQALGAQPMVQSRWERLCAVTARSAMTSRWVSAFMLNTAQTVQQLASTAMIVAGVYLIVEGKLSVGALIACGILSGRALGPLSQIVGLMMRWHQARIAFASLDKIMQIPALYDFTKTYVQMRQSITTTRDLQLENIQFTYPRTERVVLSIPHLELKSGQVVALMGPVGSGKSSLLKLLAALQLPSKGRLLLEGIDQQHLSPADWQAQVAWVGQDAVLFRGSLRENLLLATPKIDEARFMHILRVTGVQELASNHPQGLDMPLGEAGQALSGGQRQMVVLARALLGDAKILLLDEPTSAFDAAGEAALLAALRMELQGRTVVIATHRPGPLQLVSRLVILDKGRIVADGAPEAVLKAVQNGAVRRANVPGHVGMGSDSEELA
jgi:ATP-binding cassette, subfamily C, bacterial LapB